jgi:DNA-binding MarR family transcriptional regulator
MSGRGAAGSEDEGAIAAGIYGLVLQTIRRGARDMSLTTLSTLSTLDRTGPRRITDLAMYEGITQPSMTTLVSSLERSGLVERRGDPRDKRVALIAITSAGLKLLRARRRESAGAIQQLIDKLPADELAVLAAATPVLEHLVELGSETWGQATPIGRKSPRVEVTGLPRVGGS